MRISKWLRVMMVIAFLGGMAMGASDTRALGGDCRPLDTDDRTYCGWASSCDGFCDTISCLFPECPATGTSGYCNICTEPE